MKRSDHSSKGNEAIEMNNSSGSSDGSMFTPAHPHICQDSCIHTIAQSVDITKLSEFLIKMKKNEYDINLTDEKQRTALHFLNTIKCNCEQCLDEAKECMMCILANDRIEINKQDWEGNTALHLAIKHGNTKSAKVLLKHGADVSLKNNEGDDPLMLIARSSPEVMVAVLNRAVTVEKYYPNCKDCVLRLDFSAVTGYSDSQTVPASPFNPELSILTSVLHTSKVSRQMVLTHPLVVVFLDQKWRQVRKYFTILFFCYLFWLLTYTSFIIKVYLISCPCTYFLSDEMKKREAHEEITEQNRCHLETGFTLDATLVLFLTLVMGINEIIKIITIPWLYRVNKLNIMSWVLIFMVIITTGPIIMEKNSKLEPWQFQTAALAIFLSWACILRQLGTFPCLGKYVEILGHVLKNFGLSMLTFSSLFMAFALSFNVLFPGGQTFSHFFYAIVKCIMMFVGEVEYEDTFYDRDKQLEKGPLVGHILYTAFVLIVSIVLMNLLVGLTVSDIQALEKEAELTRVFRQISEMLSLETACFSNKFPSRLDKIFQSMISVTGHTKNLDGSEKSDENEPLLNNCMLIRPNDPSDKQIPANLKESMLRLAVTNYHSRKPSELSHHGLKKQTLGTVSV